MELLTTTLRTDLRDRVLSFLAAGAQAADGALQERTYTRLHQLVQNHFDGIPNQHSYERLDWRIMQRLFTHLFAPGTPAWARIGEELYNEMQYLHEPPPMRR